MISLKYLYFQIYYFRSLKQYTFVWKWGAEVEDLPENVIVKSWLPQQDILAHPNLKVFVTHGGIGSLTEAIYHKATLVGIPFAQDQKPNLLRAKQHGYAVMLDYDTLEEESLKNAINEAMESKAMTSALDRVNK